MQIKFFIITIILLCIELNARNLDSKTFNKIDNYIKAVQEKVDIPTISIGIIKENSLIYKKNYSKNNVDTKSLFYIGSLTKSFTALAIMQLVEEGKIDLNNSINKYLPWFKLKDYSNTSKITIETLLNQTSGFSTYDGLKNFDDWDNSDLALEKTIRSLKDSTLISKPSTVFHYSNVNYQILGLIIEKVSGLSYNEYLTKNIFQKLDMKNSYASLESMDINLMSQGHRVWFGKSINATFPFSKVMLPAGYIISSVEDMSKYIIAQLNNGRYKNNQVFSPSIIKQLQTPSATIEKDKTYYGYGWFINKDVEFKLSHLGIVPGYTSAMIIYPKEKFGVVVLTNTMSYTLNSTELNNLADGIDKIVHGKEITPNGNDIIIKIGYTFFIALFIVQVILLKRFFVRFNNPSKYKVILSLIFDVLIILILFFVLPHLYNLTYSGFLLFVPDMGYLMLASIIIALIGLASKIILIIKRLTLR
ncbi:serine hydrolase domain-containing protein [Campylobacterota bacterium DY0563]